MPEWTAGGQFNHHLNATLPHHNRESKRRNDKQRGIGSRREEEAKCHHLTKITIIQAPFIHFVTHHHMRTSPLPNSNTSLYSDTHTKYHHKKNEQSHEFVYHYHHHRCLHLWNIIVNILCIIICGELDILILYPLSPLHSIILSFLLFFTAKHLAWA